jgi:type I restriction enzyme S subunit
VSSSSLMEDNNLNTTNTQSNSRVTTTIRKPRKVKWMRLGDVGDICMCKRIMKNQTLPNGEIPFYKIGTFGKQADAYISNNLYEEYKNKYSFPKKGEILISASGTIGREVVYDGTPAYFQDSNIVWISNDESIIYNCFLYYLLQTIKWTTEGGALQRLYNDNIKKVEIPIPPLSEQQRIVSILDRFDTLINDISTGLPAEIAARQQQYEYYRDKLLNFKRKEA